jgi:hypothetical protein
MLLALISIVYRTGLDPVEIFLREKRAAYEIIWSRQQIARDRIEWLKHLR